MRARVFWLAFFRFVLLVLSLATIACHIAQIVLLMRQSDDTGPWFPEHIPYVLYFVGPGVSVICSVALNIVSWSSVKSIRGDRTMGILNLALMIACIVYNTLESGVFPWIGNLSVSSRPTNVNKGFAAYCNTWSDSNTQLRCWLTDGAWLGQILVAAFWLFLVIFVYAQKSSDIYDDDYDVYDFKEDVPMAVTSSKNEPTYHASSPTAQTASPGGGNYYGNQGNYQEYESYYDYPPQSPYAGYKQPVAAGGYSGGNYAYQTGGDTVHMLADAGQPQYYSPHLNTSNAGAGGAIPATTPSPHVGAQTPNAY
ncbi:hypothetical protein BJV82DRAFT_604575 [Fennellomyces sp. T-0311]|nr:hypothetical protein BJV82DRAFT_604575 [Fennellomyces sp. T-0311]